MKTVFLSLTGLLIAFQIALVATAASLASRNEFERLGGLVPAFLRDAFGAALTSFAGMTSLGFFEPLPIMIVVQFSIYVATEPAGEIESGLVDLVLARPMPRHRLVTRSLLMVTGGALALVATMGFGSWIGLQSLAPRDVAWPDRRVIGTLMAHLVGVGWCFGGLALAAGAWARRRGSAQALVGIAAVAMYLLDLVGDSWREAAPLAWFSPFHCFHGADILMRTSEPARDLSILAGVGLAGVIAAYWQFHRRDL